MGAKDGIRAHLGALQNRLENTIINLSFVRVLVEGGYAALAGQAGKTCFSTVRPS